jgi:ABC-type glycerol-3-phosphate transport system permease component
LSAITAAAAHLPALRRRGAIVPVAARLPLVGYALLLPAGLLVLGLVAYPTVYTVLQSFTNTQGFNGFGDFIGLANYRTLLGDPQFWLGVRNTVVIGGLTVLLEVVVGVLTALLLWWKFWGRPLVFVAVFIPWVYPAAFSGFAWYWMLVPPVHTFYLVDILRLKQAIEGVIGTGWWAFISVVVLNVWRCSSFIAIFVLAALNAIPTELLEYARVESKSALRRFQMVIAPLIWPFLVLATMIAVVVTFIDFTNVYEASGERVFEPLLLTQSYTESIFYGRTGLGAAINVIQLPFIALLLAVAFRIIDRTPGPSLAALPAPSPQPLHAPHKGSWQPGAGARRLTWLGRRLLPFAGGVLAFLVAAFHLLPIYWTVVQAIRPVGELPRGNPFWVAHPSFEDFAQVLQSGEFWVWMRNTAIVFGLALLLALVASLLAGYSLARLRPPGSRWLARLLFASYFIPQTAVLVPILSVFYFLHLTDTLWSVILLYQTLTIPFCTWLFYIYFRGLPPELEESAALDANRFVVFWRVVVRMSWPVIVAAGVFAIGMMATDLFYATTFLIHHGEQTVTVGLAVIEIDLDEFSNVTGGLGIAALPLVVLAAAFAPSYVRGLTAAMLEGA